MLGLYFGSIVVWFIIIVSSVAVCGKIIIKNGWAEAGGKPATLKGLALALTFAAIPIFRFAVCAVMFFMATVSKEEYNKTKDDE